jgi:hypothetical protein
MLPANPNVASVACEPLFLTLFLTMCTINIVVYGGVPHLSRSCRLGEWLSTACSVTTVEETPRSSSSGLIKPANVSMFLISCLPPGADMMILPVVCLDAMGEH